MVDDDRLTRDFIVTVMMYSVNRDVLSFDCAEGLKAFIEGGGEVDLVIAESHLPDDAEFSLLKFIKEKRKQTIFIALSANAVDEAPLTVLGADAFLAKPFALKHLFDLVQRFVVNETV